MSKLEIYERIRLLRKNHLKMSQEKFGERLGISRGEVNNIEQNVLIRPKKKEPLYRLICKEFKINYDWLMTGQGEMNITTKQEFIDELTAEYDLSTIGRKIIEAYLNLDKVRRSAVEELVKLAAGSIGAFETQNAVDNAINKMKSRNEQTATQPAQIQPEPSLEEQADAFAREKKQESSTPFASESDVG